MLGRKPIFDAEVVVAVGAGQAVDVLTVEDGLGMPTSLTMWMPMHYSDALLGCIYSDAIRIIVL